MTDQKDTLNMLDKVLAFSTGIAGGVILVRGINAIQQQADSQIINNFKPGKQRDMASLLLSLAVFLPERRLKYAISGLAGGMSVNDFFSDFGKHANVKPLDFLEVGDYNIDEKYAYLIHIDPSLPLVEKEKHMLPQFPRIIREDARGPMQVEAIQRYIHERNLGEKINIAKIFWMQQWILHWGKYVSNEALWEGHDRYRLLSKLLRVRDSKTIWKDGHVAFEYDCDDNALTFNEVLDYYGYPTYFLLISQKPFDAEEGLYPLHHILPAVAYGGTLYAVEGIRQLPIVPLEYLSYIFAGLKRVVLVYPDGTWKELHSWKKHRLGRK